MDLLLVNGIGLVLAIIIFWWFFGSKTRVVSFSSEGSAIDILVKDGIYQPSSIQVPAGKPITLRFLREDKSACSEYVLFSSINLSYQLPINKPFVITLPPQPAGEIEFTCQMKMYRGKLIVK